MSKLWKKLPWILGFALVVLCLLKPDWLPWVLLFAVVAACLFMPKRGLIGPLALPADDAFLPTEQVQWW